MVHITLMFKLIIHIDTQHEEVDPYDTYAGIHSDYSIDLDKINNFQVIPHDQKIDENDEVREAHILGNQQDNKFSIALGQSFFFIVIYPTSNGRGGCFIPHTAHIVFDASWQKIARQYFMDIIPIVNNIMECRLLIYECRLVESKGL